VPLTSSLSIRRSPLVVTDFPVTALAVPGIVVVVVVALS
jgi:hypothetical protein